MDPLEFLKPPRGGGTPNPLRNWGDWGPPTLPRFLAPRYQPCILDKCSLKLLVAPKDAVELFLARTAPPPLLQAEGVQSRGSETPPRGLRKPVPLACCEGL